MLPVNSRPPTPARTRRRAPVPWLPIRDLRAAHRARVLQHLLALDPDARRLRFGHAASDAQVQAYVRQLDFERDALFGVFDRRLRLLAFAHLALPMADSPGPAELGLSVLARGRGRGIGSRLFDHAMLRAQVAGVDRLSIQALAENDAMLSIARRAGAWIECEGGEAEACLQLPSAKPSDDWRARWARQAAELDYRLKTDARRCTRALTRLRIGLGALQRH